MVLLTAVQLLCRGDAMRLLILSLGERTMRVHEIVAQLISPAAIHLCLQFHQLDAVFQEPRYYSCLVSERLIL